MLDHLKRSAGWLGSVLAGSVRRQLIISMALVHALMMTLFIWDLTQRQQAMLLLQQLSQARALADSVAISSAGWLMARDVTGLQEIIDAQKRYPELLFAMALDREGAVMAHTNPQRRGQYVTDLPTEVTPTTLQRSPALVDVASPVLLAGQHVGWIRVGVGQHATSARVAGLARDGALYALGAILVGTLLAALMGRQLTRRLNAIQAAADAVKAGNTAARAPSTGVDEAARLARQFNEMLDTLAQRESELIESHRALERSENRLQRALRGASDGLWDWDMRSDEVYFSPRWKEMLGYAEDELENRLTTWERLIDPDGLASSRLMIQDCLNGKRELFDNEFRMRHKDGHWVDIRSRGSLERDAEGRPLRMGGTHVDITARKQAEQALQRMNEELEQRVARRTAELQSAKNEAERANHAKSEFLSRMSHELRTPLNAILGFGQLLELKAQGTQASYAREILQAGHHLLELINEVLDLARVESGALSVSLEPVALMPVLQECLTLMRPQAESRGIQLLPTVQCEVQLRADRTRLKQVLLNLLSNAVKYNRAQGSVSVSCLAAGTDEAPSVEIRVTDTGAGLGAEQQARLFVPFERLDAESLHIEGTGIGLALSKRLVELMEGEIGVESRPGSGSSFWIRLPTAAARTATAAAASSASATATAAPPQRPAAATARADILCIEDNPANLRLLEGVFAGRPDLRLLTAIAPGLGLELARVHRPALILLDINLPDMDGYAVLQCLRENELTRDIPVVAISANAMPKDIQRGRAAGFVHYLTKPIDLPHLLQVVDSLLKP